MTFNLLIDGFSRVGRVEEALEIRCEMEASGFSLSDGALCSLLSGCALTRQLEVAEALLREADISGRVLTLSVYNTALYVFLRAEMPERAKALFKRMVEEGVGPDSETFRVFVSEMGKAGSTAMADFVVEEWGKGRRGMGAMLGSALIQAFGANVSFLVKEGICYCMKTFVISLCSFCSFGSSGTLMRGS